MSSSLHKFLTLLSLAFNVVICAALLMGFIAVRRVAGSAADALRQLSGTTFKTIVRINQTVPVRATVPINQRLDIPINQEIPINTTVQVNPTLPVLGPVAFDVPINTKIPIRMTVPITFNQTVPINADVPIALDVPVQVNLRDTDLAPQIDAVVRMLDTLAGR